MLTVDVLTSLEQLESIRREWDELWRRCDLRTPFQRPEWTIAWCRHFECNAIWTPVVRRGDRLVAIAPWLIYETGARRLVAFLAGGVSDYHDVLALPSEANAALEQIFLCLLEHRHAWDACDFEQLPPWALLRRMPAPASFRDAMVEGPPCPQLDVPQHPRPVSDIVPKGQWARFGKYRRRAERLGRLALEHAAADCIDGASSEVFRLHRARWDSRGLEGALGEERLHRFHQAAALELAPVCGSVDRVVLSGRTIAGLYGFVIGRVKYCYLQGIDPEHASLSPGLLLVGLVLEAAQRREIERLDFLRGDEPYKIAWGARCSMNARRQMWLEA